MKLAKLIIEKIQSMIGDTIPKKYSENDVAMSMIKDEIAAMAWEIEQSERGQRKAATVINPRDNDGYLKTYNVSNKSTFPDYLQDIFKGQGTRQKFLDAVRRGKGKVFDRIALVAIYRLENGYKNMHGYDTPNKEFIDVVKNPLPF
jgi:hypothetical protein